jgi:hypothetical protein
MGHQRLYDYLRKIDMIEVYALFFNDLTVSTNNIF